jgi:hypothetical protein
MEAWRQWLLGGKKKKLVQPSQTRIDLTPTGLLMEGHYTQIPFIARIHTAHLAVSQNPRPRVTSSAPNPRPSVASHRHDQINTPNTSFHSKYLQMFIN